MNPYVERRARLLAELSESVAVFGAAKLLLRNGDSDFPFRQDSDFYYLTGFDEPDAALVLAPHHPEHRTVLFLRKSDRSAEIWNGRRLGVEAAVESLGVDAAFPIEELPARLPEYLCGAQTMYCTLGADESRDRLMLEALRAARARTRRGGRVPESVADPAPLIDQMRLLKSPEEVVLMRRAAEITGLGHLAAMRATRPGLYEYELRAIMEFEYARAGAHATAYQSIVGAGDNATVLHYVSCRDRLEPGALVLVDSGCEFEYYASDVTRTWPVDGRFSPEQRAIYEIVLAAHAAACAQVWPGNARSAFHDAAARTVTEGLIELGLLSGSVDENIENERFRDYFMHGTGHWLGLDVHDPGRYRDKEEEPIVLCPGMVTTIEPGIYVHRDLECDERFKGIGVRIEDDLLVTAQGHENLTDAIPKSIDQLEALVGSGARTLA